MNTSFFERAPSAPCPKGRILLLSYHFPPGHAAGVMRWQKFARFAFERGWGLDVVTLSPESLPRRDETRLEDLPDGIRVFGVPQRELPLEWLERRALAVFRVLRSLRPSWSQASTNEGRESDPLMAAPSSIPGQEVRFDFGSLRCWLRAYWAWRSYASDGEWARRAASLGRRILDPEIHRLVLSCGPPHMVHEAARRLARRSGVPLVVDLRDPWSQGERIHEYLASPLWFFLARRYERRTVRDARLIVMNTEPARRAVQVGYPDRADAVIAVPNAYDEESTPEVERDPRFLVAYAGTIYLDRTPLTLFRASRRMVEEFALTTQDFGIEFMGNIGSLNGESLEDIASTLGLSGFVQTHSPSDHASAQQFLARASMLVSLPQDSHLSIPSKVYEYMGFKARVLVFAEPESATEILLRDTSASVVAPDDVEKTLHVLRTAYRDHITGKTAIPIGTDTRFSRRARATQLLNAIEGVLAPTG